MVPSEIKFRGSSGGPNKLWAGFDVVSVLDSSGAFWIAGKNGAGQCTFSSKDPAYHYRVGGEMGPVILEFRRQGT